MATPIITSNQIGEEESHEGDSFQNNETAIEVQHHITREPIQIRALKTWGTRSQITKACAESLGFSTTLKPGQTRKTIKLIWSFPSSGASFDDDKFVVVDSASHDILFNKEVSDRITEAEVEPAALAVYAWMRRVAGSSREPIRTSVALSAAA